MYKLASMQLYPAAHAINSAPETQCEIVFICCSSSLSSEAPEGPQSLVDCDLLKPQQCEPHILANLWGRKNTALDHTFCWFSLVIWWVHPLWVLYRQEAIKYPREGVINPANFPWISQHSSPTVPVFVPSRRKWTVPASEHKEWWWFFLSNTHWHTYVCYTSTRSFKQMLWVTYHTVKIEQYNPFLSLTSVSCAFTIT